MADFKIDGDDFIQKLEQFGEGDRDEISKSALKEASARLLRMAKKSTPVQRGVLKRSWTAGTPAKRGSEWRTAVYNPVEYAVYVEHGHRQTPGRYVPAIGKRLKKKWVNGKNMLKDASDAVEKELGEILRRHVRHAVKERFK